MIDRPNGSQLGPDCRSCSQLRTSAIEALGRWSQRRVWGGLLTGRFRTKKTKAGHLVYGLDRAADAGEVVAPKGQSHSSTGTMTVSREGPPNTRFW